MVATAAPVIDPHRWYPTSVVARLVSVSEDTVRLWCKTRKLPAARSSPTPGGQAPWRIKGEDILQLLGRMELARGGAGVVTIAPPRENPAEIIERLQRDRRKARKS